MKCRVCDIMLSDYESVRKDINGQYLDTCNTCIKLIKKDLQSINPLKSDNNSYANINLSDIT